MLLHTPFLEAPGNASIYTHHDQTMQYPWHTLLIIPWSQFGTLETTRDANENAHAYNVGSNISVQQIVAIYHTQAMN